MSVLTAATNHAGRVSETVASDAESAPADNELLHAAADCGECSSLEQRRNEQPSTEEDSATTTPHDDDTGAVLTTTADDDNDNDDTGAVSTTAGDNDEREFCFDCRVDVCSWDARHGRHRRRRAGDVTAECRRRVAGQLARVTDALSATYLALLHVDQRRADVLDQLQRTETTVRQR